MGGMETLFCGVLTPLVGQFILPALFVASFVAFVWSVFYYAIVGEYDEAARNSSKALMIWSISAFIVMAVIGWVAFGLFGLAGFPLEFCR